MLSYTTIILLATCCITVQCLPADVAAKPDVKPAADKTPVKQPADEPVHDPKNLPAETKPDLPVKTPSDVPPVKAPDAPSVKAPDAPSVKASDAPSSVAPPTKQPASPLPEKPTKNAQPDHKTATHDVKYYVSNPHHATVDTKPSDMPDEEEINEEINRSLKSILPFLNILFGEKSGGVEEEEECIDDMIIQLVPEAPKWNIHPPGKPEPHHNQHA